MLGEEEDGHAGRVTVPDGWGMERLLGTFATGARGMLAAELDMTEGDVEVEGHAGGVAAPGLRSEVKVHICHSARRELEVARNAICEYLQGDEARPPSDVLVLCADWGTYAPLIEAVFTGMPISVSGGVAEDTPITHSFSALLDFRVNRFEVSKVFALLSLPQVMRRFGIDTDTLAMLRDMVRNNNIRWGYDEDFPFTWQHGLDRFVADALLGPRDDAESDTPLTLGALGSVLPCGAVEDARFRGVARLRTFVKVLHRLREFLCGTHVSEVWRDRLLQAIEDFYESDEDSARELSGIRHAIVSVSRDIANAHVSDELISGAVMSRAILSDIRTMTRPVTSFGDAIHFAPLKNASAVPAKFVWICGLNDGAFPRIEYRPSFDLIGRRPTVYDVTSRERDNFAFLKAVFGAREQLYLSYTGFDIRTNAEIPPSVVLAEMMGWLQSVGITVTKTAHALMGGVGEEVRGQSPEIEGVMVPPFEKGEETVIDLDELTGFYARPNNFLAKYRLGFAIVRPQYKQLTDDDALEIDPYACDGFMSDVLLRGAVTSQEIAAESARLVEVGLAHDREAVAEKLTAALSADGIQQFHERRLMFSANDVACDTYSYPTEDLAMRYLAYCEQAPEKIDVQVAEHLRIVGMLRPAIPLQNAKGEDVDNVFVYRDDTIWESDCNTAWIRHLVRCAAGKSCVTILMTANLNTKIKTYRPVPKEVAKVRLQSIIEKAMAVFPVDMEKARGKDELPSDYVAVLACGEGFEYESI